MPDNIQPIFNNPGNNRRLKRQRSVIESVGEQLIIYSEQLTETTPLGDIETNENKYSMIIEGEAVSQVSQIAGKCQEPECGKWLTHRTIRYCFYCGKINCIKCSKWDQKEEHWVCRKCYKSLKIKRILKGIVRVIFFPFFRKEES